MVLCHVCGTNAVSGWIYGIPPAPDRQKLGLCPEHDTAENRRTVRRQWIRLMEEEARRAMVRRTEAEAAPAGFEVEIDFIDGGRRTVPCLSYDVVDAKDLLAVSVEGETVFYPLQHIRTFRVRPLSSLPSKDGDAAKQPGSAEHADRDRT